MKSKILGLLAAGLLAGAMAANAITFTFTNAAQSVTLPASGYIDVVFAGNIELGAGESSVDSGSVGNPCLAGSSPLVCPLGVGWLTSSWPTVGTADRFFVRVDSSNLIGSYYGYVSFWSDSGSFSGYQPFILDVTTAGVPEPGTLALLGLGLAGLGFTRRRRA